MVGPTARKSTADRMCRVIFILILLSGGLLQAQQAKVQAKLDEMLRAKDVHTWKVSVLAVDLASGRIICSSRPERPLIPASNMKMVVIAAAVSRWGTEHEFVTLLGRRGRDLVVIGDGDPGLGEALLIANRGQDQTSVFRKWAGTIKERGMTQVGDIIIDDTVFDQQFVHPNWPKDQLHKWYAAPPGGLNLWENWIKVWRSTGSGDRLKLFIEPAVSYGSLAGAGDSAKSKRQVWISSGPEDDANQAGGVRNTGGGGTRTTVADPGVFFGSVLRAVLDKQSVAVSGEVRRGRVGDGRGKLPTDTVILDRATTRLIEVIGRANKYSRGLFAECLLKRLGSDIYAQGSFASGAAAVGEFLTGHVGAKPDQFTIDDGSGLSRENRLSPSVLVNVLRYMAARPEGDIFRKSLSISGQDGTLRARLNTRDLKRKLYAKTGYISGVYSLSGYMQTKRGKWIAFSILINKMTNRSRAKQLQLDICHLLVIQ